MASNQPQQQPLDEETFDHPLSNSSLTIVSSLRQKPNKLNEFVKDMRIVYAPIVPDYLLSPTNCLLFISLAYHRLHPDYIKFRIQTIRNHYRVRTLLCLVDLEDFGKFAFSET